MTTTETNLSIRERLEAHAKACRDAMDNCRIRPVLPQDIADELWSLIRNGDCASLDGARLDGASLDGARLDGASLVGARLVGARLVGASLDGASLVGARLDGASLVGARLDCASLDGASLDRARLDGASLDCASLDGASLDCASLDRARLDGASLDGARLRCTGGEFVLKAGPARTVTGGRYHALTAMSDRGRLLRYGCETRTLADWRENLHALCVQHVAPEVVAKFEREIGALLTWCESLDAEGGAS